MDAFASLAVFKKASTVTPQNRRLKSHDFKVGILVKVWRDNRHVANGEIVDIPCELQVNKISKGRCVVRIDEVKIAGGVDYEAPGYSILPFSRLSVRNTSANSQKRKNVDIENELDDENDLSEEVRQGLDPNITRSRIIQDIWHLMDRVIISFNI